MAVSKIHNFDIPDHVLTSSAMRRKVDEAAETIADVARADAPMVVGVPGDVKLPIEVSSYETDRARATIWWAHPSAIAAQAKHGLVSRAASRAGHRIKQ